MARIDTLSNFLTDVADSIREKTGNTEPIACEDFDTEIESISGGSSIRLPSEFQEVEYIEGTGTQYINTQYKPNQNTKTEISFETINLSETFVPFGTRASGQLDYVLGINFNSKNYIQYNTNTAIYSLEDSSPLLNTKMVASLDKNLGRITYNNINIDMIPTTTTDFSCITNLYLGCLNNNGNTQYLSPSYKLYYCKIWENGTLIKNLIPCYRKSNSEIGLYDLVNDTFLTNAGTGIFIKGNDDDTPLIDLQDKMITITENGTTSVTPDTGYDGLSSVNIVTNVSGGSEPSKGLIFTEWDSNGYPTKATLVGFTSVPEYFFSGSNYNNYSKLLQTVILPISFTQISDYSFISNTVIQNVNFSELSLTSIGRSAFSGCSNLLLDTLPNTLTNLSIGSFSNCSNITISKIPDLIVSLPDSCFQGCRGIEKINFNNVTSFGSTCFSSTRAYSIYAPKLQTTNGSTYTYSSFRQNTNLKAIWIGNNVNTGTSGLSRFLFGGCTNVYYIFINLPRATVETMPNYQYAFSSTNASTQTLTTDVIVCNDDEDWLTAEQFNAIDWETYAE